MKQTFWQDYKISIGAIVRPPFTQDVLVEFFTAIWDTMFILLAVAINCITLATFPLTALLCTFVVRAIRSRKEKRKLAAEELWNAL